MSDVNPGYTFTPTEQVTNTKLASLGSGAFDPTCISGRSVDSSVVSADRVLYWQSASSTLRAFTISALAAVSTVSLTGKSITQTAHGFTIGQVLYWTGSVYALAQANALSTSIVAGVVSVVTDGNTFTLAQSGTLTGLSGLVTGSQYYLSASVAGGTTATAPSAVGSYLVNVFIAISATSAILDITQPVPYSFGNQICNGRLSLTTGVPVTTSDVTGAGTVYYVPYKGNLIALNDGAGKWNTYSFSQLSATLTGMTAAIPQDMLIFINSGTVTLSNLAWASTSARATALVYTDGVETLSGATNKRYVGTIYLNAAASCDDSVANRLVYNRYNQINRTCQVTDATDSWASSGTTFRFANGSSNNSFRILNGLQENILEVTAKGNGFNTGGFFSPGVGINTASTNSAQIFGGFCQTGVLAPAYANYAAVPALGWNTINWLEIMTSTSGTWYGDDGSAAVTAGMVAKVMM